MISNLFWKLLSKIPGKYVINFAKGLLPSLWAFYLLRYSWSENFINKYVKLYEDSNILYYLLYYVLCLIFFYVILDFAVRWVLMKKIGRSIFEYFSSIIKSPQRESLRELGEMKSQFLRGMGVSMDLGYFSKKDIAELEVAKIIPQEEIEQALHEFGNLVCRWTTVAIHTLLTMIFVLKLNWIVLTVIGIIGILLLVLIYTAIVLLISNINSMPKIKSAIISSKLN